MHFELINKPTYHERTVVDNNKPPSLAMEYSLQQSCVPLAPFELIFEHFRESKLGLVYQIHLMSYLAGVYHVIK